MDDLFDSFDFQGSVNPVTDSSWLNYTPPPGTFNISGIGDGFRTTSNMPTVPATNSGGWSISGLGDSIRATANTLFGAYKDYAGYQLQADQLHFQQQTQSMQQAAALAALAKGNSFSLERVALWATIAGGVVAVYMLVKKHKG